MLGSCHIWLRKPKKLLKMHYCQAKYSFAEVTLSEIISISDNIQRICSELSNAAKGVLKREYQRIEYLLLHWNLSSLRKITKYPMTLQNGLSFS